MKPNLTGFILLGSLLLLSLSGCIRSRMIITSTPPKADVFINEVHYGRTPVEIPFLWYWWYKVELKKGGFENFDTMQRLRAPVYFWMPFDLIFEAMPFPIYDTKALHYTLIEKEQIGEEPSIN